MAILRVEVFNLNAVTKQFIEVSIVLYCRTAHVVDGQLAESVVDSFLRQVGVQANKGGANIADQNSILCIGTA